MKIRKLLLEKSAEALLERAHDCFDLGNAQHAMAEKQHEDATRQQDNAKVQQEIAARQHSDADKLSAKADKLDALGKDLVADAVEFKGDTQVEQRGHVLAVPEAGCGVTQKSPPGGNPAD